MVQAIYDTRGLLTSIALNCDELLKTQLDGNQKACVEGIACMVEKLISGAKDGPPWLADAALALGEKTPDGKPLALNWNQLIDKILELRNAQIDQEIAKCALDAIEAASKK